MSKDTDGGPAFPMFYGPNDTANSLGMSLRDYFAAHAPEPTRQQIDDYMTGWTVLDSRLARAKLRYLEADAMLAARKVAP